MQRVCTLTALAALLAAALLVLAGCGGGGDNLDEPEQPGQHRPADCQARPEGCK